METKNIAGLVNTIQSKGDNSAEIAQLLQAFKLPSEEVDRYRKEAKELTTLYDIGAYVGNIINKAGGGYVVKSTCSYRGESHISYEFNLSENLAPEIKKEYVIYPYNHNCPTLGNDFPGSYAGGMSFIVDYDLKVRNVALWDDLDTAFMAGIRCTASGVKAQYVLRGKDGCGSTGVGPVKRELYVLYK